MPALSRLLWLLSFAPAVLAMAVSGAPKPVQPSPLVARGKAVFQQYCSFCHGPDAAGGAEGPDLMRSALVRHDRKGDLIGPLVRDGRPGTKMPPFPLAGDDIGAIAAFLHQRVEDSDETSPSRPHDAELKLLLTGDAAAGKAYFDGPGRCAQCHSPAGDLRGIASRYSPGDLQARFLYPRGASTTAGIVTRDGRRFGGKLLFEDAFSVAIVGSDGWYHSWPRSDVQVQIHDPLADHLELLRHYTDADIHNLFAYLETLK